MTKFVLAIIWLSLASSTTLAEPNQGWFEIIPSSKEPKKDNSTTTTSDWQSVTKTRALIGKHGDKLYYVQPNDSLTSISLDLTGFVHNRHIIAEYNRLDAWAPLTHLQQLIIPSELLRGTPEKSAYKTVEQEPSNLAGRLAQKSTQTRQGLRALTRSAEPSSTHSVESVTTRRETMDSTGVDEPTEQALRQSSEAHRVSTEKLDMFAGEVRVLGVVDVTRVAVGNGKLIRAEVLANGELLVIAQEPGSSSLRLWHTNHTQSDYNIRISEKDPETRFHLEKMVQMKVHMVEFRKSALGKLGIDWGDSMAGPIAATAGDIIGSHLYRPNGEGFAVDLPNRVEPFSSYFGIATNITSRINLLASKGDAVTLAEPVLSCANGGTASFLAGGEVPYPSENENGQTSVEFKEYGIKLTISPRVDDSGNVQTLLDTEISQLDPAVTVQGAPGLLTRRTQTQVNVRSGETIVISGLLSAENSKDIDRLPGLGQLPVLGALFRSKNVRNAVSELVVFITPEVIEPGASSLTQRQHQVFDATLKRLHQSQIGLSLME
ncbi:MAG: pilus assembly protein N-terminal domain-containing protein [Gammaproteobacteria bacterium]|nr:pilus assembly protein N-terminal domain-containing protein [Gammaproteobacteria bacterium]